MLLDPFEEQFNLPTALIKRTDGGCVECRVVGEKDRLFCGLRITIANAAQVLGVVLLGVVAVEPHALIANDAG
jgi:hypothetical protein